jgi:hypothetical protein
MTETYRAAAEAMRGELKAKVEAILGDARMADVLKLHQALNGIEDLMGETRTPLGAYFSIEGIGTGGPGGGPGWSSRPSVRFDEFVGLGALEAAKVYLKKASDARPFTEILEAIRSGGGEVGNEEKLRTGLSRSTLDVVKIGDRYGMLEKYPHMKRGKKKGSKTTASAGVSETADESIDDQKDEAASE